MAEYRIVECGSCGLLVDVTRCATTRKGKIWTIPRYCGSCGSDHNIQGNALKRVSSKPITTGHWIVIIDPEGA